MTVAALVWDLKMNVNGEGLAAMPQAQPAQSFRDVGQCRAARHGNELCAILEPDQHIGWDKSVAGKIAHSFEQIAK